MKLKLLVENKNFRFLWIGQLICALGERLTQMGILTFVMVVSGDNGSKMALITFLAYCRHCYSGRCLGQL